MNNYKVFLLIIVGCVAYACCYDCLSRRRQGYIVNESGRAIDLYFYKNGSVEVEQIISMKPGDSRMVLNDTDAGEGFSFASFFAFVHLPVENLVDSLSVHFDQDVIATHYMQNKQGPNPKGLVFESDRNLFNPANWQKDVPVNNKRYVEEQFRFTFTEQDYLDAQ